MSDFNMLELFAGSCIMSNTFQQTYNSPDGNFRSIIPKSLCVSVVKQTLQYLENVNI